MPDSAQAGAPHAGQPLLTIAIPTYNREAYLREFLAVAGPQIREAQQTRPGELEFICSDNASTDGTAKLLDDLERLGVRMTRLRQPENIGSDRNFVACFRAATGRYFWLCGDDDVLRPGSIATVLQELRAAEYDWIYLPPEPFHNDWQTEYQPDPHGRGAQRIGSAREMALRVNVMVTFITGLIVNRERLLSLAAPAPDSLVGTNLVQLSWSLPLLQQHRQSLILWQRLVAGRQMNSGGYSLGHVFGERFVQVANRLLPGQPRLAVVFTNVALRRWFPSTVLQLRESGAGDRFALHEAEHILRSTFTTNFRFWLFTWPVIRLPLAAARLWAAAGRAINRLTHLVQLPADPLQKLRSRRNR